MHVTRTRRLALVATATALGAAGAAGATSASGSPHAVAAATKSVKLTDDRFKPAAMTVKRGTTVRFKWRTKHPHNVLDRKSGTRSGNPKKSGSYSKRYTKKGSFTLVCVVHSNTGMKLRLRVK